MTQSALKRAQAEALVGLREWCNTELRDRLDRTFLSLFQIRGSGMTWISVKERLPEDGQDVLAWIEGNFVPRHTMATFRLFSREGQSGHEFIMHGWDLLRGWSVTAWQPLPKPPESSSANGSPSALVDRGNSLPPSQIREVLFFDHDTSSFKILKPNGEVVDYNGWRKAFPAEKEPEQPDYQYAEC